MVPHPFVREAVEERYLIPDPHPPWHRHKKTRLSRREATNPSPDACLLADANPLATADDPPSKRSCVEPNEVASNPLLVVGRSELEPQPACAGRYPPRIIANNQLQARGVSEALDWRPRPSSPRSRVAGRV